MNVKKEDRPDREADLVLEIKAKDKGRRTLWYEPFAFGGKRGAL